MIEMVDIGVCACDGVGLRFCEEHHKYWDDGFSLPSVTTLISSLWPRTDGAPAYRIEQARLRGSWVDEQFMAWLSGHDIEIGLGVNQGWVDALEQATRYWEKYRLGAKVECQVRLFGWDFAGTADLIVEGREILELKSTYDISTRVPAQLGGYADLYVGDHAFDTEMKCGVLHCHRHLRGGAVFRQIDYSEAQRQWAAIRDYWRLVYAA